MNLSESDYIINKIFDKTNDKKSINCQARAVAIYVSIRRNGKCDYYLSAFEKFKELYKESISGQMSLFDL